MPAWKPAPETVTACALTKSGKYLVITNRGNTATADEMIPVRKRVRISGGKARAA